MFIVKSARVLLTPSEVKCSNVLRAHGTPDGVRALAASVSINMALLTERGSPNYRASAELKCLKTTSPTLFTHFEVADEPWFCEGLY